MENGENAYQSGLRLGRCLDLSSHFSGANGRGFFFYHDIFKVLGDKITGKDPEPRYLGPEYRGP